MFRAWSGGTMEFNCSERKKEKNINWVTDAATRKTQV